MEYQSYLKDCDCKAGGIIFHQNIACCRWCRKPYAKGGKLSYEDEHFKPEEIKPEQPFQWTEQDICNVYDTFVLEKRQSFRSALREYAQSKQSPPTPQKEWEILKEGYVGEDSNKTIFSVKRLSDGEVFSVGDDVFVDKEEEPKNWVGKIIEFWLTDKIPNHNQELHICYNGHHYDIKYFKKPTPSPKEERIEVRILPGSNAHSGGKHYMALEFSKVLTQDKYEPIKEAIEAILNNIEFHHIPGVKWDFYKTPLK